MTAVVAVARDVVVKVAAVEDVAARAEEGIESGTAGTPCPLFCHLAAAFCRAGSMEPVERNCLARRYTDWMGAPYGVGLWRRR